MGNSGDGGTALNATIEATRIAVDEQGNLYLSCSSGAAIRKITASTGIIDRIAGTGNVFSPGINGVEATKSGVSPDAIAVTKSGLVYFSEPLNNVIRILTPSAVKLDEHPTDQLTVSLAPNPSNGNLTIQSPPTEEVKELCIYDQLGNLVLKTPLSAHQLHLDISQLPDGAYLYTISGRYKEYTGKLILVKEN